MNILKNVEGTTLTISLEGRLDTPRRRSWSP